MRQYSSLILFLAVFIVHGIGCSSNKSAPTPPLSSPVAATLNTPSTCGGGPGATPAAMNANATTLANLIISYRIQAGATFSGTPNTTHTGVAQFHAQDMSTNEYIGFVATDGEDPFRRLVCSGSSSFTSTGVIAVGYSTDPRAVFDVLRDDFASNLILLANTSQKIGVGYSNGYWMIIMSF